MRSHASFTSQISTRQCLSEKQRNQTWTIFSDALFSAGEIKAENSVCSPQAKWSIAFKPFGKRKGRKAPRLVESVNSGVRNILLASCNVHLKFKNGEDEEGRRKSGSGVNNRHQWSTNEENKSQEGINSFPFC